MSGFDFDVQSLENERDFIKSLLGLAQLRASRLGVEFKYRWQVQSGYYVTVDGSLTAMEALHNPLIISLISLAEGTSHKKFALRKRVQLARRITSAYAEGLDQIADFVREIATDLGGEPNSYTFRELEDPILNSILTSLRRMLADYHFGMKNPRVVAEEIHTAMENLMNVLLGGKARDLSFASKAEKCVEKQYISEANFQFALKLKNLRRGGKHRGTLIKSHELNNLLEDCISIIHKMTNAIADDKNRDSP